MLFRYRSLILSALLATVLCHASRAAAEVDLTQYPWVRVNTAHFKIYSCGPVGSIYQLAGRLELFHRAYSQLTGTQAMATPPVIVLAFPTLETMQPYLPKYEGQAINAAGLFQRGNDENLIVLSLSKPGMASLDLTVVFHEYAHFLFRQNDLVWPLWMKEGMAEIYSTFQTSGHLASIGGPIDHHLQLLSPDSLMPLAELFSVKNDSAQYNERQRQGIFYAESWLLTQFLVAGDNPNARACFSRFTALLRQGQAPEQAFTNALQAPFSRIESEMSRYLAQGAFRPITLSLGTNISAPVAYHVSAVTPVELNFRLGDELMRMGNEDAAAGYFVRAQKMAPASPLPEEGLGLLSARRGQHDEASRHFKAAIDRGSESFLAYYLLAQERYRASGDAENRHSRLNGSDAAEIRNELEQSIRLMPDFGPARELSGFFEMVQGDNLEVAKQQLLYAIQLEPENRSYLISLAQLQIRMENPAAARETLQPLLTPGAPAELRTQAQAILTEITNSRPNP